jgi:hypothetical protein
MGCECASPACDHEPDKCRRDASRWVVYEVGTDDPPPATFMCPECKRKAIKAGRFRPE